MAPLTILSHSHFFCDFHMHSTRETLEPFDTTRTLLWSGGQFQVYRNIQCDYQFRTLSPSHQIGLEVTTAPEEKDWNLHNLCNGFSVSVAPSTQPLERRSINQGSLTTSPLPEPVLHPSCVPTTRGNLHCRQMWHITWASWVSGPTPKSPLVSSSAVPPSFPGFTKNLAQKYMQFFRLGLCQVTRLRVEGEPSNLTASEEKIKIIFSWRILTAQRFYQKAITIHLKSNANARRIYVNW